MPNFGDQFDDHLVTPADDLLPKTEPKPQGGPLPPRKKKQASGKLSLFPKISIRRYQPSQDVQNQIDEYADQLSNK
jgi:hypothetical protein